MIETIKISEEQAKLFRESHKEGNIDIAKTKRKYLWARIRAQHGLPESAKLKVQLTDPRGLNYLVICDKITGLPLGKANSGMPYGKVPIANAIPFLNTQWDVRAALPASAISIGGGMFVHQGELYFPAI